MVGAGHNCGDAGLSGEGERRLLCDVARRVVNTERIAVAGRVRGDGRQLAGEAIRHRTRRHARHASQQHGQLVHVAAGHCQAGYAWQTAIVCGQIGRGAVVAVGDGEAGDVGRRQRDERDGQRVSEIVLDIVFAARRIHGTVTLKAEAQHAAVIVDGQHELVIVPSQREQQVRVVDERQRHVRQGVNAAEPSSCAPPHRQPRQPAARDSQHVHVGCAAVRAGAVTARTASHAGEGGRGHVGERHTGEGRGVYVAAIVLERDVQHVVLARPAGTVAHRLYSEGQCEARHVAVVHSREQPLCHIAGSGHESGERVGREWGGCAAVEVEEDGGLQWAVGGGAAHIGAAAHSHDAQIGALSDGRKHGEEE